MTPGWQGAPYFRRHDGELVSKTHGFVNQRLGEIPTVERLVARVQSLFCDLAYAFLLYEGGTPTNKTRAERTLVVARHRRIYMAR